MAAGKSFLDAAFTAHNFQEIGDNCIVPLDRLSQAATRPNPQQQPPDMCQDPKKIRDPGSPGSRIRDPERSWSLYFHFIVGS